MMVCLVLLFQPDEVAVLYYLTYSQDEEMIC